MSTWYEIRLRGRLAPRWAPWFDGMSLRTGGDGGTVIRGPVVDQAALHGLLRKLRDTGLPVISVAEVPAGPAAHPTSPEETDMTTDPTRRNALAAGILYLITFAASIPALVLIQPILHDASYIVGAGHDTRVLVGCVLDLVNAVAAVGTAVAVFPVVKRENEALALGFVTSRMYEAAIIAIGVVSLLAVVTLRQDHAGASAGQDGALVATGHALVAVRDWTFLLGPGLMPAINALLFGTLLYRSRLVPRIIPAIGLVGAPLLLASDAAVFFGLIDQVSSWAAVATLPVALWEFSVGVWMAVKGFNRSGTTPSAAAGR